MSNVYIRKRSCTAAHTGLRARSTLLSGGDLVRPKGTQLRTQLACRRIDEVVTAINTVLWALDWGGVHAQRQYKAGRSNLNSNGQAIGELQRKIFIFGSI